MTGTSPAQFNNSPSYHSSSYLPKMEAAFMKDFTCCGLTLASLHDLLQHFEEVHANAPASRPSQSNQGGMPPTSAVSAAGMPASQTQTQGEPALHTQHGFNPRSGSTGGYRSQRLPSDGFNRTSLSTVQDMDSLDNMEMDDIGASMDGLAPIEEAPSPFSSQQQSQFNQNQSQLHPLNINLANTMQHQGLRTSTPSTPAASQQFGLQNNPTVSSVNTPTLGTAPMQNTHSLTSPESSHPGTPAELDMDFANGFGQPMVGMGGMDMSGFNMNFGNGMGGMNGMPGFDGTIDQPGKRLFSKHGGGVTQQQLQAAYNNFQKMGTNDQSDLAKRLREQQIMAGANIPQLPFPEEVKPFRCPVIGCEKAYKNQNGLKYHKQVCHV
jgi:transcription factor SFP1